MNNIIEIEGVKKKYKLGAVGGETLTADIQSWWARKCGKEDPNLKIGVDISQLGEEFYALNGIDLNVKKGEALGIIGANGAGKSTLLKILSRVTAPSDGEIRIQGRIASMLEVGTGFHGELTGRENIYMNGAILGMSKKEIDKKIEDIIDFSECRRFIDTPVKRYSSGMYVKLAFAVASHLDAEIMIMDEVLAVGDMVFQKKCLDKMATLAEKENKTILYVSHNMATIRNLCQRCVVLQKGSLIYDGNVETAIGKYMSQDSAKLAVYYDFLEDEREYPSLGNVIHINAVIFSNKETAVYSRYEPLKIKVDWDCFEDIKELKMYLIIRSVDYNNVGIAEMMPFIDAEKGGHYHSVFQYDASNLTQGKYFMHIEFCTLSKGGTRIGYDRTNTRIFFELDYENENTLPWMKKYWGNVRLNSPEYLGED